MAGYKAFQEKFMGSDLLSSDNFTDFDARRLRYAVLWAMYENSVYSKMHVWTQGYKAEYGLYKYIRGIYNPSYRIGEFWKTHLLGGKLDPLAGDGSEIPSCLPIKTEFNNLRAGIAQVWKWSNWQFNKDVLSLRGPILGDGVIKVIDDPAKSRVYMKIIHPGTIKEVEFDDFGNVKGYVIEETRADPRPKRDGKVTYREIAERDGDLVVYSTYLDGGLYAWNEDQGAEWSEGYGFVPMVIFQHNNVGLDYGWSELHPAMSKIREVDDQASKLGDQIRKLVSAPWLISNMDKPKRQTKVVGQEATDENPQPEREEMPLIYAGKDNSATATALVAPLDLAATSAHIQNILKDIENDYPELRLSMMDANGDVSGKALRINRGPAEDRVLQRRPNYDDALVRAQKMALSIGGFRGYEAFGGIDLDSFAGGKLEHSIGERPVFGKDPLDEIEKDGQFWTTANQAKTFGVPPLVYLKSKGWTKEQIAEIEASPEYQARMAAMEAATDAAKNVPTPSTNRFGKNQAGNVGGSNS